MNSCNESNEIKETNQIERTQRECGRGNCGRENCGRGRRASHKEGQRDKKCETNIKPNIELDNSGSYHKKEVELNIERFVSTYESMADSEYSNILTMELPINSQNESSMPKTVSHSSRNLTISGRFASTYESIADSKYFNILNMESPINSRSKSGYQLQSRVMVSDLFKKV
ncbi:hypothetical protein F8M41_021543 [Gigaspora margarita]|uniref:Uncharacterized protein n=1 Tax=Gigaspora margarita TaxID=4874 RepID=A0A8H4AGM7_GIGMA|nr:hypothetical protein F8M41_021543 [Gigaspora margarita]